LQINANDCKEIVLLTIINKPNMKKHLLLLFFWAMASTTFIQAQTVVNTYSEDFEDEVSLDLWRPNTIEQADGTPAFDVSQADGVLKNTVSMVNFFDGQFYNFAGNGDVIFDITDNTYISFDVKVEPGATYDAAEVDSIPFLVSPWGPNADGTMAREFLAIQKNVAADGQWYTLTYDISDHFGLPDWDGAILENSYTDLTAILVETVIWPSVYAFTMEMDNFHVGEAAAPAAQAEVVTTYSEDFEEEVSLDLWRPNTIEQADGTPAFDVSQADGVLKNTVNMVNFFDGQFYNFMANENLIFDITDNTYITFDVKVEPGATYDAVEVDSVPFLVSPWGPNMDGMMAREFLAIQQNVPADGEWHTMRYDISDHFGLPDWDGAILENDYSEITAILVETVIWPSVYAFSMEMDNFHVGAAAAPPAGPAVVTSYTEDFEEAVSFDLWRPNTIEQADGSPAFDVSQADGVLKNTVNMVNFFDGQFYNFLEHENLIFDITGNPYITFDVKVEPGATYDAIEVDSVPFLVSPWGPNADGMMAREFLAIQQNVPADGEWHTMRYNISDHFGLPDWDGAILENNYADITAILVETVIWPSVYAFSMEMDNFHVGDSAAPPTPPTVVTSYTEDFEEAVSFDLWRPNTIEQADGTPAFDVSQADGVLKNTVSMVNFFDGQFYNFLAHENLIFDITENPYITFDVKVEPGATYDAIEVDSVPFLVSPWGPNMDGMMAREFLAIQQNVPADGEWHTLRYNISDHFGLPDWDGAILENNYADITAILVETVIWPSVYAFTMEMDNFHVGDSAAPAIPPTVVTTYTEDFEDEVSFDLWRPNTIEHADGRPAFDVSQADGVLKNTVDMVNFFDGQFYNFLAHENLIFDITDNPYISFDVKVEPGATYDSIEVDSVPFLVSPWGPNMDGMMAREFLAIQQDVPADGEWHTMRYDISDHFGLPDWDGAILENDYSEITAILVETVIWPSVYAFTMEMDNFHVGEAALVSISDTDEKLEFSVFPNPVVSNITIQSNEIFDEIVIYDLQGRIMQSISTDYSKLFTADISLLDTGMYILKVNGETKTNAQLISKN